VAIGAEAALKIDKSRRRSWAHYAGAPFARVARVVPQRSGTQGAMNEEDLRATVRVLLQGGLLPERRPDRTWGRPGRSSVCAVCALTISRDEIELEAHFGLDVYHVHTQCFTAWQQEVDQASR